LTPDEHPLIRGPAVLLPDGVTAGSGPFNLRTSSSTLHYPSRTRGQHAPRLLAPWLPPTPSHDTHSHPNIHSPHTWKDEAQCNPVSQSLSGLCWQNCTASLSLSAHDTTKSDSQTRQTITQHSEARKSAIAFTVDAVKISRSVSPLWLLPALWSLRLIAVSFLL
jgi:hypothetical protein